MKNFAFAPNSLSSYSRVIDCRFKPGPSRWTGTLLLLCTLALSACGGGGGAPPDPPADPATGTQWDQMKWDQGKWG